MRSIFLIAVLFLGMPWNSASQDEAERLGRLEERVRSIEREADRQRDELENLEKRFIEANSRTDQKHSAIDASLETAKIAWGLIMGVVVLFATLWAGSSFEIVRRVRHKINGTEE